MSTAERFDDYRRDWRQDRWSGPRFHPGWIILMIVGFLVWWPIGLALLGLIIWSKNMGCHGGDRWERKMERMEEKMGRVREKMERFGGGWGGPALERQPRFRRVPHRDAAPA